MVRLTDMDAVDAQHLLDKECPPFETQPWVTGPPLAERRVAIVTTAGIHRRDDARFAQRDLGYRVIPGDLAAGDLVMSHGSSNFDRSGFQQDINVVFPIDRLRELVADGVIGSVADFHYSFMGATEPEKLEANARALAGLLKEDRVNAVLLTPV